MTDFIARQQQLAAAQHTALTATLTAGRDWAQQQIDIAKAEFAGFLGIEETDGTEI